MTTVEAIIRYNLKAEQDGENLVEGNLVGRVVSQTLTQDLPDTFEEAIEQYGETEIFKAFVRMLKVDFSNINREKLKASNGHSSRAVLSEEQKAVNKKDRSEKSDLFALAKAKGMTVEDIKALLG